MPKRDLSDLRIANGQVSKLANTSAANVSTVGTHSHSQYHTDALGDARYYRQAVFVTEGGDEFANGPVLLDGNGLLAASMLPGVSGVVQCSNATLIIANGLIVEIQYTGKDGSQMTTMVLGNMMGAVYRQTVYEEARQI